MSLLDAIIEKLRPKRERPKPLGISEEAFKSIQDNAKQSHPDEFLCFLVGRRVPGKEIQSITAFGKTRQPPEGEEDETYLVLDDFYVIPGTKSTSTSAQVKQHHIPVTEDIFGTLHTHPSGSTSPSQADKNMFAKHPVNIIFGAPYEKDTWEAYNQTADEVPFGIVQISD